MINGVNADVGFVPRNVYLDTDDLIAAVQTAGYLNLASNWADQNNAKTTFLTSDYVRVKLQGGTSSQWQAVAIDAAGQITLSNAP